MPTRKAAGPTNPISQQIHREKYRIKGETFDDFSVRIADGVKDDEEHFRKVLDLVREMKWLPAGRQQLAVGNAHGITAVNCFVSGVIPDDFTGICHMNAEAGQTLRMGGGIGMDFSTLRPNGALIKKINSQSSGPIAFMGYWDALSKTIQSKGLRRGAMMGVLRVDHPDILQFIRCKRTKPMFDEDGNPTRVYDEHGYPLELGELTSFNISVAITDEFMRAVENDDMYEVRFEGRSFGQLHAPTVWEEIMRNTWDYAEPGVLFIDRINHMNPLYYCETIAATNPCAEQPLPPHGACLLGSMNCTAYLRGELGNLSFDFNQFREDIPHVVRSIDNILDRTNYPLPQQEHEAKMKRRMGLGVTGLANTIELLGHKYASDGYIHYQNTILTVLRDTAYKASIRLAEERGPFPVFDAERWLDSGFAHTLPDYIRDKISKHGLRNGMLLSIAPAGTISMCADNVSAGIEPPFAIRSHRDIITEDGKITVEWNDWAFDRFGFECTTANEIDPKDHVRALCSAQQLIDSSISKTCNIGDHISFDSFKRIYMQAYKGGAKGCTTYRANGKRAGIMREVKNKEFKPGAACYIDPTTGQKECA